MFWTTSLSRFIVLELRIKAVQQLNKIYYPRINWFTVSLAFTMPVLVHTGLNFSWKNEGLIKGSTGQGIFLAARFLQ